MTWHRRGLRRIWVADGVHSWFHHMGIDRGQQGVTMLSRLYFNECGETELDGLKWRWDWHGFWHEIMAKARCLFFFFFVHVQILISGKPYRETVLYNREPQTVL